MSEVLTPPASNDSRPLLPKVGSSSRARGERFGPAVLKMPSAYARRQAKSARLATREVVVTSRPEVKPQATARRRIGFVSPTILTLAGLAELGIAVFYLLFELSITTALSLHGLVAMAWVISVILSHPKGRPYSSSYALLMVSAVFLGPVGVTGMMLTTLVRVQFGGKARGIENSFFGLFPESTSSPHSLLCERILNGESSAQIYDTLVSFSDVMANGAIDEKQAVIALISSQFKPAFASVLQLALSDHEPAVRVQAATAVAHIESTFLETAIRLKDRCDHEPERSELALALARHFDEYANSGLLDVQSAEATRLESLKLYRHYLQHATSSEQLDAWIIRLLVRLGRLDEAVALCAPLVDAGKASTGLLTWYAEALFELRRYSDLRMLCGKFQDAASSSALLSEPCQQAMALWAGDSSPR